MFDIGDHLPDASAIHNSSLCAMIVSWGAATEIFRFAEGRRETGANFVS